MIEKLAAIKYFTDTNVAKAVAVQLRNRGVDVVRCEEVGMAAANDAQLLAYAAEKSRVMVSHDDDFLNLDSSGGPRAGHMPGSCTSYLTSRANQMWAGLSLNLRNTISLLEQAPAVWSETSTTV